MATTETRRRAPALAPDERRDAIVRAAVPLLLDHGEHVTTKQVAEAAGIAEGTIFRVFPDKGALLDAVVTAALDPAPVEEALGAIHPDLPLDQLVVRAVQVLQRRIDEVWRLLSRMGPRAHGAKKPPTTESAALVRLLEAHRDELTVPPRQAARALRALTFGMSHPALVDRPAPAKEIAALLLRGVASC